MGIHDTHRRKPKAQFGICFDIDGVLARGTQPIPAAKKAMDLLKNETGSVDVPVVYVTNSLGTRVDKAHQLTSWLKVPVHPSQLVQAQAPLAMFKDFHNKYCLVVGQGKVLEIARDLGFTNVCTMEQVAAAHPLLDVVDHDNRRTIARGEAGEGHDMPRVEVVVLLGEPKRWETHLQLLVDLLLTDGKPDHAPVRVPEHHIPVLACNMDLQFMDRASSPRFGHGAFLLCLEALYKKISGHPLRYTALVGKPSEVTYRFAEHCLAKEARRLGIEAPLTHMYLIGDTVEVDIVGANLYQRYLDRINNNNNNAIEGHELLKVPLPASRTVPRSASLSTQSVTSCSGLLVCTGCYNPATGIKLDKRDEKSSRGHRDFSIECELYKPAAICKDVQEAVQTILDTHNFKPTLHIAGAVRSLVTSHSSPNLEHCQEAR